MKTTTQTETLPDYENDIFTEDHESYWLSGTEIVNTDEFSPNRFHSLEKYADRSDVAEKRLKRWMKKHGYFPNVWFVSDHGNCHLRTIN